MGHDAELLAAAGAGGVSPVVSNGSAFNFDCDDLTGWSDDDQGAGVSSQVTFGGRSTFKLDGGAVFNASNRARRSKVMPAAVGDTVATTYIIYNDSLPTSDVLGGLVLFEGYATNFLTAIAIEANRVGVYDGSAYIYTATVAPIKKFTYYTVVTKGVSVPATALVDVYRDESLIIPNADGSWGLAGWLAGELRPSQFSREFPSYTQRISYIDQIIRGDGLA